MKPEIAKKIYKYGKYFCPAGAHYNAEIEVGCDRCQRCDIDICIGWCDYDICMGCMCELEIEFGDLVCETCDCNWSCCECCECCDEPVPCCD